MDEQALFLVTARSSELRGCGLTATMVIVDFLRRRLMPLRDRGSPVWLYTGINDVGWMAIGPSSKLSPEALEVLLTLLLSKHKTTTLPDTVVPLCNDTKCAALPVFDAWRVRAPEPRNPNYGIVIPDPTAPIRRTPDAPGDHLAGKRPLAHLPRWQDPRRHLRRHPADPVGPTTKDRAVLRRSEGDNAEHAHGGGANEAGGDSTGHVVGGKSGGQASPRALVALRPRSTVTP